MILPFNGYIEDQSLSEMLRWTLSSAAICLSLRLHHRNHPIEQCIRIMVVIALV